VTGSSRPSNEKTNDKPQTEAAEEQNRCQEGRGQRRDRKSR
jgi:hypothetical protein